ncbi:hypothetical protein THASP1DRAFT_33609 [Thamnocephalis sphaerospora]|uniref:Uncharacterized protein n=1 Tax=Thamnocephalis sphaerospora TaxID=78915 RepID=A0A4P9XG48_9FUNG|nr:hypothetical protein THASP1DRAFT_33609 [Thamnocephalis sphaerospora]|eukprot:RKP04605.1 hypothetical protein THASP1DRAFT_33609 [Thamnocephalis sphaerospora]
MASSTAPAPPEMTPYIEDVDLSGFKGMNLSLLQPSPYSRVVGDWETLVLGTPAEYQEIALGLIPVVILLIRFGCNTYMAIRLLESRREAVFWLNLIQTIVGVIACVCAVMRGLMPWTISCHGTTYSAILDLYVGTSSIVGILFAKAYYGTRRSRAVLCLGVMSIFLTFAVGFVANWSQATFEYGARRCAMALDYRWIVAKFSVDIISNVSLSGCFLYTMWMQCRNRKHHIFWMFFQDGLIYGFGVIISNVIVTTLVLTMRSLAFWHAHMYGIDYCMISTLACWQLWQTRTRRAKKSVPKLLKIEDLNIAKK